MKEQSQPASPPEKRAVPTIKYKLVIAYDGAAYQG